ncbi:MAG TPA: hypothetical protein VMV70_02895, partial [Gallionella sp.]|nr:hypothetical protein [Gallionella sp.]
SAAIWAPQAQAIPAFARQVGMPCSACHYQHFPVLNSFGRAFKEGGFTMVGAEQKIEGDGLSIPATLNLAFVTNLQYTKTNGTPTNLNQWTKDSNNGQFSMTQYSLFMGGRVGHGIGFEGEVGLNGGAGLASVKMPFAQDWGSFKTLEVPFTTDGLGPQQGFEILSDGASVVHLFNQEDLNATSAQAYVGTATSAHGLALVAANDYGFVNFTKFGLDSIIGNGGDPTVAGQGAGSPTADYLRAAWLGNIGDFDAGIGFQSWSGHSAAAGANDGYGNVLTGVYATKATAIDAQMMGDLGSMPLTLIASYANAPASTATDINAYNSGADSRKSFNIAAELGVLPKTTVQLGLRNAKSGISNGVSTNASDNAVMLGATYSIALNVRAEFTYSKYSGDLYSSDPANNALPATGDQFTAVNLWMGF